MLQKSWGNHLEERQKQEMPVQDNQLEDSEVPRPAGAPQPLGTGAADLVRIFKF